MMPEIQKILYATDLSDNSAYAFQYAMNSAKKHNAGIIILHVLEELPPTARTLVGYYVGEEQQKKIFEESVKQTMDRIRKRIKIFCDRELKDDPEFADRVESIEVCKGYPADEILKKADELNCDAIIMGTHGKGIIRHTFLGSVTKKVLRRVRKPVFIIPLPKGETGITFHDF
ncbi:MAG: universal stress protein [Deltaproteobacteria bacterium]|nr:universal stress protein [Deltaproteobacteria bacterium]